MILFFIRRTMTASIKLSQAIFLLIHGFSSICRSFRFDWQLRCDDYPLDQQT